MAAEEGENENTRECKLQQITQSDVSDLGLVLRAPEDGHVSQRSIPPHQSRLAGGQQAADGNEVSQCRERCGGAGAGSVAQRRCEAGGRWGGGAVGMVRDGGPAACGVERMHQQRGVLHMVLSALHWFLCSSSTSNTRSSELNALTAYQHAISYSTFCWDANSQRA
ncbi:hypothetical protein EYF80_013617 [Liparis tanakae]|uniref:Uncharacterized protein n=1 Tax=Liparis tanakae TaxID=230148 RepID=A0A4Z2IDQ4_9TELE|nr:hypothetical protein EYF80_013617 [Liparis tanakae]